MGGAIFNMGASTVPGSGVVNITNCTLVANTAQGGSNGGGLGGGGGGYGGAIFNLDGTLNLTFCTLADNTVTGGTGSTTGVADGAAVYNLAFGNTLGSGSAVTAATTLTDSILVNSTSGRVLVNNVVNGNNTNTATVTLNGPNRVSVTGGTISGDPPITANPRLGPLQNNGGLTPTMALQPGSPVIGIGRPVANVTIDQRGFPRPAIPSLGAFEPQPLPPPPPEAASVQFTDISVKPNLLAFDPVETIHVHVSGASGGTVTFTLDGQSVQAAVDANGNATVSLDLPFLAVMLPQGITADYNGASAAGSAATTAFWTVLDALLPAVDTFLADGTQLVQFSVFGLPLLFFVEAPSGRLEGFGLGAG
jgi:hypothetical protein